MAVGTLQLYTRNFRYLNPNDLLSATVMMALVDDGYTPDFDETSGDQVWGDISSNEIANGNGYVTGGLELTSKAIAAITDGFKFSSANAIWTASSGPIPAWRRGIIYASGSLWGLTSPLIGAILGDDSPADVPSTSDGNDVGFNCPANGWFDVS